MATIVHDPSEARPLCPALGLYLKPITKLTISVALPQRPPGKAISNWEVMERLKAMAAGAEPEGGGATAGVGGAVPAFSSLRIAKSTLDFIRFEAEVEQRALVQPILSRLDGRTVRLGGFPDPLRVRAAEFRPDFPSRHDWDAFFRDARDMNERRPGERPDTIRLEGLPCRWFAPRGGVRFEAASASTSASRGVCEATSTSSSASTFQSATTSASTSSDRPSEALLREAFGAFGEIRQVDIPMLDPYREDTSGGGRGGFHTFGMGGVGGFGLYFEAYVQYHEYAGFVRAMAALRGVKLMFKGEDGKAVACGIKVSFDATKHLSEASIRRRHLEQQKLRELELQREEQKRREREEEEQRRAKEQKQKQLAQQQRELRREEKLRRREERARDREQRRSRRRAEKLQAEEQRRLQEKIRTEERKLLLAQRNLQSIRLVAKLLGRVEAAKLQQRNRSEERRRRHMQEEQRRLQEAELRRVEEEKARALGLQRCEQELRQRLLSLLLSRCPSGTSNPDLTTDPTMTPGRAAATDDLLQPVLDILHRVTHHVRAPQPQRDSHPGPKAPTVAPMQVLACIRENAPPPKPGAATSLAREPPPPPRDRDDHDKCNREPRRDYDDRECERRSRSLERPRQHRKRACGGEDTEEEEAADATQDLECEERRRCRKHIRERKRRRHSRSRSPPQRRSAWNW